MLEKCVKYANEIADDIIHSTGYYMKYMYIKRAILTNLLHRPLNLGRHHMQISKWNTIHVGGQKSL